MWSDFIAYGVRRGEFRDIDAGEVIDILLFSYQGVRMLSPVLPVGSETRSGSSAISKGCS